MGDRDNKFEKDDNRADDKSRLLARKAGTRRSSLLRDAINAVDAALGSDRKSKRQDVVPVEDVRPFSGRTDVQGIEYRSSQDIIEQALIEIKSQNDSALRDVHRIDDVAAELPSIADSFSVDIPSDQAKVNEMSGERNHPLQGKIDPGRTQRVRFQQKGELPAFFQEPVVAWLVVVQGPGLGAYKAVFEGNNTIGRAPSQHIQLNYGDEAISSEEQAFIRYDPQDRSFLFIPNLAKTNVVSVNEDKPTGAVSLKSMDIISMGRTRMAFVPFCGEEFDWSDIHY